jgi:hypothetical protein
LQTASEIECFFFLLTFYMTLKTGVILDFLLGHNDDKKELSKETILLFLTSEYMCGWSEHRQGTHDALHTGATTYQYKSTPFSIIIVSFFIHKFSSGVQSASPHCFALPRRFCLRYTIDFVTIVVLHVYYLIWGKTPTPSQRDGGHHSTKVTQKVSRPIAYRSTPPQPPSSLSCFKINSSEWEGQNSFCISPLNRQKKVNWHSFFLVILTGILHCTQVKTLVRTTIKKGID